MANTSFDDQIRDRIQAFTEELTELVRQSAVESLRQALGATDGAASAPRRRGRPPASAASAARATTGRGRGRPPKAAKSRARAKGAKRDPNEILQLTDDLYNYVASNPGQRIEQIAEGMGTSTKELNLPAKKLIGKKQLRTKGQKRATTYFAK